MTGTLGLLFKAWRTVAFGFQCVNFCIKTSFGTPGRTRNFNMTKPADAAGVSEDNYVSVDEDKLKEEQKQVLYDFVEKFKHECLKSYSVTEPGEVIKKFDFPVPQPLTEAQRDNKMIDLVYQAMGQAFINSAPVVTKTVHNAVLKMVGATQGYEGPCYIQPSQMNFAPIGSTTTIAPSASAGRSEENNGQVSMQTTSVTSLPQTNPIFSTAPPVTTEVQGGSASGFPLGWDPMTGIGMPPEFFVPSSTGQFGASATQPMVHQQSAPPAV